MEALAQTEEFKSMKHASDIIKYLKKQMGANSDIQIKVSKTNINLNFVGMRHGRNYGLRSKGAYCFRHREKLRS